MSFRTLFVIPFLFSNVVQAATNLGTPINIPNVIVKAIKPHYSLTSAPKMTITRAQMNRAGITNVAQALQNLAGVQLHDAVGSGASASISLRGFGENATSNTLFLVNGIPITNPDMAGPNLNTIPLYAIEVIEVIAGSESVLYGDQAVGGVVNIITRGSAAEKAELACSVGSYDARYCYATVFNHYRNLQYNLAVSTNHTDNYRAHNQYDQNFLLARFDYLYATGKVSFDMNVGDENMQYPGALNAAQVRQNRRQSSNNTDFFKDSNVLFHLKHLQMLTDRLQLETDIVQRGMHGHGVLFSPFTQSRMIYFVKPQLKLNLPQAILRAGVDAQSDQYRLNSQFGLNENKQQKYSIFTLGQYAYSENLLLTAGVRLAQQNSHLQSFTVNNNLNRAIATTLGGSLQVRPDLTIYLRRAENFRFPKADENANSGVGIKGLRTQRGVSYETGIALQRDRYHAAANFYLLNLRDEIAFDPTQTPQQPFGANRNLAPTARQGFSLSGKYHLMPQLAIDGQYNYVNARFSHGPNTNNRIPLVAENILRSGLDFRLNENWRFYAEAIYTGNQFPANDDANISGAIGGYTIYNFNIRYQQKNLQASLHFNNIFNKDYYFYTVYRQSTNNQFFYPAPERNITLTVKYLFL